MAKNTCLRNFKRARKAKQKLERKKAQRTPEERAWDRLKEFDARSTYKMDFTVSMFEVKKSKKIKDVSSQLMRDKNKHYQLQEHWWKLKKQNDPESAL